MHSKLLILVVVLTIGYKTCTYQAMVSILCCLMSIFHVDDCACETTANNLFESAVAIAGNILLNNYCASNAQIGSMLQRA